MKCRECDERIVRQSPIPGTCKCCYETMDLGRHTPVKLLVKDEPVECERCRDTGRVLVRDEKQPVYMYVRNCPECNEGGEK